MVCEMKKHEANAIFVLLRFVSFIFSSKNGDVKYSVDCQEVIFMQLQWNESRCFICFSSNLIKWSLPVQTEEPWEECRNMFPISCNCQKTGEDWTAECWRLCRSVKKC
jgi:hypothetical protein